MAKAGKRIIIVGVLALLWNLMGALAIAGDFAMDEAAKASLTQPQQALLAATPAWSVGATVVALLAGLVGSIALLMRRRLAVPAFFLSFLAVIAQDVWMFGIGRDLIMAACGSVVFILQGAVLLIALLLWLYARRASAGGALR